MLRLYRCARFSAKSAFTVTLVCVVGFIGFALVFSINHGTAQKKVPVDHVLETTGRKRWDRADLNYGGLSGKKSRNEVSTIVDDHSTYHGNSRFDIGDQKQAQRVVSLLNMFKPPPSEPPVRQEVEIETVLNLYVEMLHQAIREEIGKTKPVQNSKPMCSGGIEKGEVEDLLCIPRPKFLDNVKNPCWYSSDDQSLTRNDHSINPSLQPPLMSDGVQQRHLRCLPYFHILGCAKSGTTDLWNRLMEHPHIISNDGLLHKEALWWSWRRFGMFGYKKGIPRTFNEYVDVFQDTARLIQASVNNNNHYHKVLITGDASPPDFWDFRGWRNISQNRGLEFPKVITPHLMNHMYTEPRFILMFKDPLDRLYSDYFFVGGGLTSEDFHQDIAHSISLLAKCVKKFDLLSCFYDNALYKKMKVRLPFACYSIFMREWLRVFPLERFLFIKTEEYEKDPEDTLKKVMNFLGLHPLKESKMQRIVEEEHSRITMQKQVAGPMKEATKAMLLRLLQPCNQHLVEMIRQPQFMWNS